MSPRIACLLTSPGYAGGTETAMQYTQAGLESLRIDAETLAVRLSARSRWSTQAESYVQAVDKHDIVEKLNEYDGVILSNTYFTEKYTRDAILDPALKPAVTSGWHGNDVMKTMLKAHEHVKSSPRWTGNYVRFWTNPLEDDDVTWVDSILPYQTNFEDTAPNLADRQYDLSFIGRIDPRKGAWGFAVAMNILADDTRREANVLMAGAPNDLPGGPHIFHIRVMLHSFGWSFDLDGDKMKSTWTATKNGVTLRYSGAFDQTEMRRLMSDTKCFVNLTSIKASANHFEYSTLEAFDAQCVVLAPYGHDTFRYDVPISMFTAPTEAVYIRKGNRVVFNDVSHDTMFETYRTLAEQLAYILDHIPSDSPYLAKNRSAVLKAHRPELAAAAYMKALKL